MNALSCRTEIPHHARSPRPPPGRIGPPPAPGPAGLPRGGLVLAAGGPPRRPAGRPVAGPPVLRRLRQHGAGLARPQRRTGPAGGAAGTPPDLDGDEFTRALQAPAELRPTY